MSSVKEKKVYSHLAQSATFSWVAEEWREPRKLCHVGDYLFGGPGLRVCVSQF